MDSAQYIHTILASHCGMESGLGAHGIVVSPHGRGLDAHATGVPLISTTFTKYETSPSLQADTPVHAQTAVLLPRLPGERPRKLRRDDG